MTADMTLQPPFALFITAADIPVDYINQCLIRAWRGNFGAAWDLWLVTDYNNAPKNRDDHELPEGTRPPISTTFVSPFAGKTYQECAQWLKRAPSNVAIHRTCFAVVDEYSRSDGTVMGCRIVDADGKSDGGVKLQGFPQSTDWIVGEMTTNGGNKFVEKASNYKRTMMRKGTVDRSLGFR